MAHTDSMRITVPVLLSILENPEDFVHMKRKKEKFIKALYHYNMVDDKDKCRLFIDSWSGECEEQPLLY